MLDLQGMPDIPCKSAPARRPGSTEGHLVASENRMVAPLLAASTKDVPS